MQPCSVFDEAWSLEQGIAGAEHLGDRGPVSWAPCDRSRIDARQPVKSVNPPAYVCMYVCMYKRASPPVYDRGAFRSREVGAGAKMISEVIWVQGNLMQGNVMSEKEHLGASYLSIRL